jgi:hypothetical protein
LWNAYAQIPHKMPIKTCVARRNRRPAARMRSNADWPAFLMDVIPWADEAVRATNSPGRWRLGRLSGSIGPRLRLFGQRSSQVSEDLRGRLNLTSGEPCQRPPDTGFHCSLAVTINLATLGGQGK